FNHLKEEKFDDAHSFIDALRLTNPRWSFHRGEDPAWLRGWYFRGQGNAEWPVIPTAFRKLDTHHPLAIMRDYHSSVKRDITFLIEHKYQKKKLEKFEDVFRNQVEVCFNAFCEFMAIKEFILYADELGHSVPMLELFDGETNFIEDYIDQIFGDDD